MLRFRHSVKFRVNPDNPYAVNDIISKAKELLTNLFPPGRYKFTIWRILHTDRPVGNNQYQIFMELDFESEAMCRNEYFPHPLHVQFAEFLFEGLMLEGYQGNNPTGDLVKYILTAGAGMPVRTWVENPAAVHELVLYDGEESWDSILEE